RRGIRLRPGQALQVPDRLVELLSERLALLSESVRRMLLLISASAQPTLTAISHALADPPSFDDDVRAALQADVIEVSGDRVWFSSPLLGTALYSGSPAEERRRAHQMLAAVSSDREERARHLAQAADGPDEDVAQLLEDAAQRAWSHA